MELELMELKFNYRVLKRHYRAPEFIYLFILNFQFVIIQLSKNRVLNWNSILENRVQNRGISLISLGNGAKC